MGYFTNASSKSPTSNTPLYWQIALQTGETLGGLLNATFGNVVKFIVAILAFVDGKVAIVKTSLIGSLLSNSLLVMGFCFFFGGLGHPEQNFNTAVAQTAASMLALAAASVIVPTLTRGNAVILLVVFSIYLFFQLKTHQEMFSTPGEKANIKQGLVRSAQVSSNMFNTDNWRPMANIYKKKMQEEEEEEQPQLRFWYMVDSIDAITQNGALPEKFVGLILLPIVGNAAEHVAVVTVAMKDKVDLAIAMNLSFDHFQVALMFVALLLVNYLTSDGKSH
ncbi:Ca2+ transporter [Trichoderma velutinum]